MTGRCFMRIRDKNRTKTLMFKKHLKNNFYISPK